MTDTMWKTDPTESAPALPAVPEERQPGLSLSTASAPARKVQGSIGACDACRLRKVRCLANESSMSSKCQRCTRANRECVYTTHSKTRRRKRTDTRVKELEEKVRGLSMLLESRTASSNQSSAERDVVESLESGDEIYAQSPEGLLHGAIGKATAEGFSPLALGPETTSKDPESAARTYSQSNKASYDLNKGFFLDPSPIFPDVIERGILDMAKATELFNRYVNGLLPVYPAVVLPPDWTPEKMRESRPILFLAVLAASAGASKPALNLKLNKEIQQVYATKVTIQGRKSIEICQAMLISILWTYPPDKFEDLKFHQQITQAATMALDLGLAQKPRASASRQRSYFVYNAEDRSQFSGNDGASRPVMASERGLPDSAALESRRTLLACYVFCASVTMSLRLPNMLRFSSWMAECVDCLENSEDAAPTDKRFVAWVKMQRIVEECGSALALDDLSVSNVTLADQRVQVTLSACEKQLDAWRRDSANVTNCIRALLSESFFGANANQVQISAFLEITYHSNNIYLHEIALHPDHDAEDFRPPFFIALEPSSTQSKTAVTPAYINAIIQCTSSADSLITTFLNMSVKEIHRCPTLVYVRVVYATVILIKLSISESMPSSELGKILDPANNKIETYFEQLLTHLKAVAEFEDGGKHVISSKFLGILTKLRLWCQHQKQQNWGGGRFSREPKQEIDGTAVLGALAQDVVTSTNAPVSGDEPALGASYSGHHSRYDAPSSLYVPSPTNRGAFFTDFGRSPANAAMDQSSTQLMDPTSWPTSYPTTTGYPEPASMPFNFAVDAGPKLFTHLVNAELGQSYQDNWMPDAESLPAMDFSNPSEFNWVTWPQQGWP